MKRALFLVTAATILIGAASGFAQSNRKDWIPLGGLGKALYPSETRKPQFRRGGKRIEFFVAQGQLPNILSQNLSTACAHGRFNQRKDKRYYVIVNLDDGRKKRFGYADSTGFNLHDPDRRVGLNQVYLFDFDNTSECRVYAVESNL
ncbi:hypothetical protein [Aestuariispira insulae]|uniref:Uncharacterized protein n=1 Tax=Aestuariispira insulae TaxID=1461337 RepID=A0A3D9HWR4_9PROT|nr:hypothetical protein [Aestuariispira insulae]RED53944.1 hypothetical protein DFP90_101743 [Aestuariispira insulae]